MTRSLSPLRFTPSPGFAAAGADAVVERPRLTRLRLEENAVGVVLALLCVREDLGFLAIEHDDELRRRRGDLPPNPRQTLGEARILAGRRNENADLGLTHRLVPGSGTR